MASLLWLPMFDHAFASFSAEFPDDPNPEESRCEGIGQYLADRLRETGVCVTDTDLWRDCGFLVQCKVRSKDIYFFVIHYGKHPLEYVLCCTSDTGIFGWLRGVNDTPERWELARAVHAVMAKDARFRDIRWYIEGWFADGDEPWQAEPC